MIRIDGISKTFGGSEGLTRVLTDVSFDVRGSEVLAIVGPSGAGKSTLLQIIGTLMTPDSGHVLYDGTDVLRMPDRRLSHFRSANIGFVFQQHRLLPEFTLLENVALPALIAGSGRKQAFEQAKALICRMGLDHRLNHRPDQLSGGECQRASVARALINKPRVVLADEPSGSLDSANRRQLHQLFFDLRADLGVTFVIVTHDESLASGCDRTVHMVDGRISQIVDNNNHL